MRTVVVGNRKLSRHLLHHLFEEEWNIVGAIVPKGKLATEQANFVTFDELIAGTACELHKTDDINSSQTQQWLKEIEPDVCISGGWSQIIDEPVLDIPNEVFLGYHSSQLPRGRGGAPVNWGLISGAEKIWITLFEYAPGVDAGDILVQGSVRVEPRDDIETVFDSLATEACNLASKVGSKLTGGTVDTVPQSLDNATYRPRRQPQDGLIDWNQESRDIYNWVRAQTKPYPGAYTFYDGQKLTIWSGESIETDSKEPNLGEVDQIVDGEGIDVKVGNGVFRMKRVKYGGKPSNWADRFAREVGLRPGDTFGRVHAPGDWLYTGMQRLLNPEPFDTNLTNNDQGVLGLLAYSGSQHQITVSVIADSERIFEETAIVNKEYRNIIEYGFEEIGTHTISITFARKGETIDKRYLKVYVTES